MELRKFVAPEFIIGNGAVHLVSRFARNLGAHKILLVTDPGIEAAGWKDVVIQELLDAEIPFSEFNQVSVNPRMEEVEAGTALYHDQHCDVIVGLGGGSVLDCAKGIGICSKNPGHLVDFAGVDKVFYPIPPLVCIPTTGGSSADVSQFAIITNLRQKTKFGIVSKTIVPDVALIDPKTLTTLPPYIAAYTGIDALVHAIEAYVSNASSAITDLHALAAIKLLKQYLIPSVKDSQNMEAKEKVMLASLEAGLAFSNASLGVVHAMAHSLGGYSDLPHGRCNAMLLRAVIEYNFEFCQHKFQQIAEIFDPEVQGLSNSALKNKLQEVIVDFITASGVEANLSNTQIHRTEVKDLAKNAMRDLCVVTNPREPKQRDIELIYEEAL
ncbi:MAG: alcohol dehydrogenase-like regulatory protein ErcA [Candidatus Cyclobacteriaceae bacterium M3_2C_046]